MINDEDEQVCFANLTYFVMKLDQILFIESRLHCFLSCQLAHLTGLDLLTLTTRAPTDGRLVMMWRSTHFGALGNRMVMTHRIVSNWYEQLILF